MVEAVIVVVGSTGAAVVEAVVLSLSGCLLRAERINHQRIAGSWCLGTQLFVIG